MFVGCMGNNDNDSYDFEYDMMSGGIAKKRTERSDVMEGCVIALDDVRIDDRNRKALTGARLMGCSADEGVYAGNGSCGRKENKRTVTSEHPSPFSNYTHTSSESCKRPHLSRERSTKPFESEDENHYYHRSFDAQNTLPMQEE